MKNFDFLLMFSSCFVRRLTLCALLLLANSYSGSCCFGRKKKNRIEEADVQPIRLYRISQPQFISSTNQFIQPVRDEVIPPIPPTRLQKPTPPSSPSATEQTETHLTARPMPFRGNTDFNNYKDEMRTKGVQHTIPKSPSSADEKPLSIHSKRSTSFVADKDYFSH